MTGYSHRATRLSGVDPRTDRVVLCALYDRPIARIYRDDKLPVGIRWRWFLQWNTLFNTGDAPSLQAALETVRARHLQQGQPSPEA